MFSRNTAFKNNQIFLTLGTLCLLSAVAAGACSLEEWQRPADSDSESFELGHGAGKFESWGRAEDHRVFFPEFLPALFERTIVLHRFDPNCELAWIFTGKHGGFTVSAGHNKLCLYQRFYDSPAFNTTVDGNRIRHPERRPPLAEAEYKGRLQAVTISLDDKLGLSVLLNERVCLKQRCLLDVSRHQLKLVGGPGKIRGELLRPKARTATVRVDTGTRYQTMIGFGGICTPTAYAQLSKEGKQQWWRLVREYNLLIQREYPMGRRLSPEMNNWDRLEDATPHYYGDNFPNGEVSDFEYIKTLRKLGGKVWFEFWALPPWVGNDIDKYADAMVRYCQISREKAGAPPDIVGIQNEKRQSEATWHEMTLALRRKLDEAGFESVQIHMSDAGTLEGGIGRAEAFRSNEAAWGAIDFAATHMYDYQQFFTNPDGFDTLLLQWKELTADKPFLSTELCINSDRYQWPTYRIALQMAQLYHKNLVLADAAAVCYCWTLLNVVQPSYGWTRALVVPDRSNGFVPVQSSHQLRVFGSYSRLIHEGMVRVEAEAGNPDILVSAFAKAGNKGTIVVINRSTTPRRVSILWPGVKLKEFEIVDPYNFNIPGAVTADNKGQTQILVQPGAIVTATNVVLGRLDEKLIKNTK